MNTANRNTVGFTKPSKRLICGIFGGIFIVTCYVIFRGSSKQETPVELVPNINGMKDAQLTIIKASFTGPLKIPPQALQADRKASYSFGSQRSVSSASLDYETTLFTTSLLTTSRSGFSYTKPQHHSSSELGSSYNSASDASTTSSGFPTSSVFSSTEQSLQAESVTPSTAASSEAVSSVPLSTTEILVSPTSGSNSSKAAAPIFKGQCSQSDRVEYLKQKCEDGSVNTKRYHLKKVKERLMVDHKHETIFCVIPKCGSSTWKTMMVNLTGNDPHLNSKGVAHGVHDKGYLKRKHGLYFLNTYPEDVQQDLLKKYFKFLVVRHPLDRLYSAFNGKFIHGGSPVKMYKRQGEKIKAKYGERSIDDMERPIEFWEYLKFVADTYESVQNGHWTRYIDLCNPCEIDYDYIVKLETSGYDSEFIVDKMTGKEGFFIPQVNSRRERGKPERVVEQYKNVPQDVMDDVLKYYDVDMKLFGYTWNESNYVASCKQKNENGECC